MRVSSRMQMRDQLAAKGQELQKNEKTQAQAVAMMTKANQCEMMIQWDEAQYAGWYDADMQQFSEFDGDGNGNLDPAEV